MSAPKLTFLGGAGTVTGSKFLLETGSKRILVDCGLFQGYKQLRLRNWKPLPIKPEAIDAVILTHAHIDHSGYVPVLIKNGFKGRVHCTEGTEALCEILWLDSGHLQEREAHDANRGGWTRHSPAKPLYDQKDAEKALGYIHSHAFDKWVELDVDLRFRFHVAGHILGAAIVEIESQGKTIIFSGDLGRPNDPIMMDPARIETADYLILESTYGNRLHPQIDPEDALEDVINRTLKRGGSVIIPSFAVGRAQTLMFHVNNLMQAERIPDVPVYLDSPMAIDASDIFCRFTDGVRLSPKQARAACRAATFTRSTAESKVLDRDHQQKILISASGMATGGRILYHLKEYVRDPRHTILFAGFQAGGTRGAHMLQGAEQIKIHGAYHPVRAEVTNLHMLSAHADQDEIMSWLTSFKVPPRQTYLVHGEPDASDALRHRIQEELQWPVLVAEHGETVDFE